MPPKAVEQTNIKLNQFFLMVMLHRRLDDFDCVLLMI